MGWPSFSAVLSNCSGRLQSLLLTVALAESGQTELSLQTSLLTPCQLVRSLIRVLFYETAFLFPDLVFETRWASDWEILISIFYSLVYFFILSLPIPFPSFLHYHFYLPNIMDNRLIFWNAQYASSSIMIYGFQVFSLLSPQ